MFKKIKCKSVLQNHSLVHSTSYDFKCNQCTSKFKSKCCLQRHSKFVHSDKSPTHKCNKCEKSFKTRTHLQRHMLIHLNLRQFKCNKCYKTFKHREN
jgi:KRAB domain-containing zinc finger protein